MSELTDTTFQPSYPATPWVEDRNLKIDRIPYRLIWNDVMNQLEQAFVIPALTALAGLRTPVHDNTQKMTLVSVAPTVFAAQRALWRVTSTQLAWSIYGTVWQECAYILQTILIFNRPRGTVSLMTIISMTYGHSINKNSIDNIWILSYAFYL